MEKLHIDKELSEKLDLLVAALFDDKESRLGYMEEERFDTASLPREFHRNVLEAFYAAEEKNIPPSIGNISLMLSKADAERLPAVAAKKQPISPRALVIWINAYIQNLTLNSAVDEIGKLGKVSYLDANAKREAILDLVAQTSTNARRTTYSELQAITALEDLQAKRVIRAAAGKRMGGILHCDKLRELAPVLVDGDITLFTAPPKTGKTTSVMYLAEENAYRNDTDVLVLLTETAPVDILNRIATRDMLIPMRDWRSGRVDLTREPFKKQWKDFRDLSQERWDTLGRIYYEYSPGMGIGQIESHISTWKRVANQRGRPLLVILDYLQRIKRPSNQNDVQMLAMVSNQLKDTAASLDIHMILFSQETFSKDNKLDGDSKSHGSNTPLMIAQNHIAIRRKPAEVDIMVGEETDIFGGRRYYQRAREGQMAAVVKYEILRSNNDETGGAFVVFENPMFRMIDVSAWTEQDFMRNNAGAFQAEITGWDTGNGYVTTPKKWGS